MRDYRDAKAMARSLRENLKSKSIDITHSETLELIAKALGFKDWNVLSAKIESDPGALALAEPAQTTSVQRERCCSFCGKSQDDVKKLIAGPAVFICDECVGRCEMVLRREGVTAEAGSSERPLTSRADGQNRLRWLREMKDLLATGTSTSVAAVADNDRKAAILDTIRAMTPEQRQVQAAEVSKRIAEIEGALDRLP
jgi:hypothetical protein